MAVPTNKRELLRAIEKNYADLQKVLADFPREQANWTVMPGHVKDSEMSLNNLLAYLIGWGTLVLKWHSRSQRQLEVDWPETGYKWNQLGLLAQKFYQDYDGLSVDQLCEQLDRVVGQITVLISTLEDAQLYETTWYGKWTLGRMIQFNTASPYLNAKTRIRKYLKTLPQ